MEALDIKRAHKSAGDAEDILRVKGLPFIGFKKFHNLERSDKGGGGNIPKAQRTPQERFQDLLSVLVENDFRIKEHDHWILDEATGRRTQKVLDQVVFCSSEQIELARRFCSDFLLIIDATFNTNDKNLLLSSLVGVTNTGRTFPVAFSFQPSEAERSFTLTWQFLDQFVFHSGLNGPAVIMGDQAPGFVSSMGGQSATIQLCQWHIVQNMKKRLLDKGYSKDVRENEFHSLIWNYVKSADWEELDKTRKALLDALKQPEKQYLLEHWVPKEESFVNVYTRLYPNLGHSATQRVEGYHNIITASLNPSISVEEACKRLANGLRKEMRIIMDLEDNSRRTQTRLADRSAFKLMFGQVTNAALERMAPEWEKLKEIHRAADVEEIERISMLSEKDVEQCEEGCDLPTRFGLPCSCFMAKAFVLNAALPLSLVHPRWLIDGRVGGGWKMGYETVLPSSDTGLEAGDLYRNHGRNLTLATAMQLIDAQVQLSGERADYFAYLFKRQAENLLPQFNKAQAQTILPERIQPKKVPFKSHGKVTKRGLTGLEQGERAERQVERLTRSDELLLARLEKVKEQPLAKAKQTQKAKGKRPDLSHLTDDEKRERRNQMNRDRAYTKKLKEQHLEDVTEEIVTKSYIERDEQIWASTAPGRIETIDLSASTASSIGRKRSLSNVSIEASFTASFYQNIDDTCLQTPPQSAAGPSSTPRSGVQPFIMTYPDDNEYDVDEAEEALFAVTAAQIALAQEEKADSTTARSTTVESAAAEEGRRPRRKAKGKRFYGDSQVWSAYVNEDDI